jgi:hypothetical protein
VKRLRSSPYACPTDEKAAVTLKLVKSPSLYYRFENTVFRLLKKTGSRPFVVPEELTRE